MKYPVSFIRVNKIKYKDNLIRTIGNGDPVQRVNYLADYTVSMTTVESGHLNVGTELSREEIGGGGP